MINIGNLGKVSSTIVVVILGTLIGVLTSVNYIIALLCVAIFIGFFIFSVALKNPKKVLWVAIIFLPFTSVMSIQFGGAKISIPDALFLFLGILVFIRIVLLKKDNPNLSKRYFKVIISYTLLVIFGAVFSILSFYSKKGDVFLPAWAGSYNGIMFSSLVSNVRLIIPLFVLLTIPSVIKSRKDYAKVLKLFVIGSLIVTIYGVYEFAIKKIGLGFSYLLPNHAQSILFFNGGTIRLSGTFGEPSYFAGFLVLSIFLCVYCKSLEILPKFLLNLIILSQLIVVILTYSTGGYLALLIGTLVYLFNSGKVKFFISVFILSATLIALVVFVPSVVEVVSKPFDSTSGQMSSNTDRTNTAKAAMNMFKDSPLYGIGYGNFSFLYNNYRPEGAIFKVEPSIANNVYADFISSYGLIGLLLLFFIALQVYKSLKVIKFSYRSEYPFFIGAFTSILIVYMAYPTFSYAFQWVFYSLLLVRSSLTLKS
ncbi:O-antigen ligase family protein [Priestia megaterium]|uniref:O-antigen ligase family protein n=1 Tax=Priestia megaterium TaxID=1404 RepID=UPI002877D461|nr:O-antigen ligase family protein [Priestia megaterium]